MLFKVNNGLNATNSNYRYNKAYSISTFEAVYGSLALLEKARRELCHLNFGMHCTGY